MYFAHVDIVMAMHFQYILQWPFNRAEWKLRQRFALRFLVSSSQQIPLWFMHPFIHSFWDPTGWEAFHKHNEIKKWPPSQSFIHHSSWKPQELSRNLINGSVRWFTFHKWPWSGEIPPHSPSLRSANLNVTRYRRVRVKSADTCCSEEFSVVVWMYSIAVVGKNRVKKCYFEMCGLKKNNFVFHWTQSIYF